MTRVLGAAAAALLAIILFIAAGISALTGGSGGNTEPPSRHAITDIPADYLRLYLHAATTDCPGLSWTILAAIGKVESDHGRSHLPGVRTGQNEAGARGPMQFLQSTFDAYSRPVPTGGVNPPSPYHPVNAIHAASRYLCASGAPDDLNAAIYAYNHADWYVAKVLAQAAHYSAAGGPSTDTPPAAAAATAIDYAMGQLGMPYIWGGDGPDHGHAGFDCSGLTTAAYAAAGIVLPRTAHTQYNAGPLLPPGAALAPGDLIFYGNPHAKIHHVALYIGGGRMIHAPTFGDVVRIAPITAPGQHTAASRPTWSPQ